MGPRQSIRVVKVSCLVVLCAGFLGLLYSPSAWAVGDQAAIDLNHFHPAPGTGKILTVDQADVGPDLSAGDRGSWSRDIAYEPGDQVEFEGRTYVCVTGNSGTTPGTDAVRWQLVTPTSWQGLHLQLTPQTFLHFSDLPLVYTLGGVPEADVVRNRLTADFSLALSLWRRFQVSLALPITLYQGGEQVSFPMKINDPNGNPVLPPPRAQVAGQEDLRLSVKGVFYRTELWGVGGAGDLALPTGNANSYLGSRLPTFNLRAIGHVTYKRFTGALNVGWLFASTEQLLNVSTGMGLTFGLGAQVEVYRYKSTPFYLLAEAGGLAHSRFNSLRETPIEVDFAAKTQYRDWTFFLGAGPGVTRGYGEPNVRVFLGASWAWRYLPKPRPPAPPPQPPPPPNPPTCVGEECPEEPAKPIDVNFNKPRISFRADVFFDFDKSSIKPESYPVLDELVSVLKARPDLHSIRVEGHTDSIGADLYNRRLSRKRAHSVVFYLLEHGIESGRLSYVGFGKRCPLVPNDTADNRARNRRVEFFFAELQDPNDTRPQCPVPPQEE